MILSDTFVRAFERRAGLYGRPGDDCFRLFNAAGDGIDGLTIDLYGDYLLLQLYFDHVFDRAAELLPAIETALVRLPRRPLGLLVKDRRKIDDGDGFTARRSSEIVWGSGPPAGYGVQHNGITVIVDLVRGQHTGLFLDMREIRRALEPCYQGLGHLLNLFSYTAVFSVHALASGAGSAVNVDLSAPALEKARENYHANGLECDDRDFIRGDSFDWLRRFSRRNRHFDFIIFDPPTFSRNKRGNFSVKKDYNAALHAIGSCARGGLVLSTVNADSVSEEEYRSFHPAAWRLVYFANESSDFVYKTKPYLKAGLWRISP